MLDWLACALVKTLSGVLCLVPAPVAVWLGERVGDLVMRLSPKRTRVGLLNLRAAFDGVLTPTQSRRIIRACYRQLGAGFIELLRLPVVNREYVDRHIVIEGRRHLEDAIASRRPVILLTGHYGNWELSSIAAALNGYPIVALARAQDKLPKLYKLLVSYRESKGCTIIHKGGAMKRFIVALERGRLVGIVADQASRQGIAVEFFGRPALFATGPFELARSKGALILPAFIHRVHGPFHRVVIEPAIAMSARAPKEAAVREGIERFAAALSRHIRQEPGQWLWMHKRWKHTPRRRVLVLSDGKLGHLRQSLAVVEALREQHPDTRHEVVEIRYRHAFARAIALLWSWWMPRAAGAGRCLQWTLSPISAAALLGRYADLIISCGSSTAAPNLLWAAENQAKSVVIMNPAPLPLRRFSLVVAPRHDQLPRRSNVVETAGAFVSRMTDGALLQAKDRLHAHARFRAAAAVGRVQIPAPHQRPVIAVFIGGDTVHYHVHRTFAETLIAQLKATCDAVDGWCLVTTSRRTAPEVEQALAERLEQEPRCRLLLLAHRDPLNGTMEGMLGSADVAVVTGESISMISEACASGRQVVVVEPPLREARSIALTKHQRFLRDLAQAGHVERVAVPEVSRAIQRALQSRQPPKRLDDFALVRDAVSKLL